MSSWSEIAGPNRGTNYAARFARLSASGVDVHGEATFCTQLVPPGARVLDAGCGTGRVAVRLADLGYDCVGVDVDGAMLEQARAAAPAIHWIECDLAGLDGLDLPPFQLIVAAGNVMPLLDRGTEAKVLADLARLLRPGGLLVSGFGLDGAHLPIDEAPFGTGEFDAWCEDAGLSLAARYATWSGDVWDDGGYAVSVHQSAVSA